MMRSQLTNCTLSMTEQMRFCRVGRDLYSIVALEPLAFRKYPLSYSGVYQVENPFLVVSEMPIHRP